MIFLLITQFSQGNGSRNVRTAFQIMPPGIHQEKSFWLERRIRLWRCHIMHHRPMSAISADRVKTQVHKQILLPSAFFEILSGRAFGNFFFANMGFEPVNKLGHRNAIFKMRFADIGNLCGIFYSFHPLRRVRRREHFHAFFQTTVNLVIDNARIQENFISSRNLSDIIVNLLVRLNGDPLQKTVSTQFLTQRLVMHKPKTLCRGNHCKRQNNWHVRNITPTDIKKPCNIIQGSQNMNVRLLLRHFIPKFALFLCGANPGIDLIEDKCRMFRKCWALFPNEPN